jgi:hypothetical protein|tara:strand:+ start:104 stop:340 length:237 start_codon:yes stop_codon:yes gene_type:complete
MKKVLRVVCKVFLWLLHLAVTGKERQMYQHAKYRNREVVGVSNDAFGSTYTMGRRLSNNEKPQKNFLTWKEFRGFHNF